MIKAKIKNKAVIRCVFLPPGSSGGQQEITGKPKILSSNYHMTQIKMTIKQRSDG